jgi:hypothetical protein
MKRYTETVRQSRRGEATLVSQSVPRTMNRPADVGRPVKESVDFLRGSPSIRPLRKRGLLGANGFPDLFLKLLNRSPRVAAFLWRRIEGRMRLSTLSETGRLLLRLLQRAPPLSQGIHALAQPTDQAETLPGR